MCVSVIIPVYNAERYVREAVESALAQPETGEVILIEDASTDNSLQVCEELAQEFKKVSLLRHRNGKNQGAGASRNLGIKNAKFDCIAFLDADDFFLSDRFSVAKQLFQTYPDIEGVYEALGVHFENEAAERRWRESGRAMMTTMKKRVPSDLLFEEQSPVGNQGYCPTGGWVVKRSVFDKTGLFDESLRLHQDTAIFVKLAVVGKMVAGRLEEPVAMRRVHDNNRITAPRRFYERYQSRVLMWITLWKWGKIHLNEKQKQILLTRFIEQTAEPFRKTNIRLFNRFQSICKLALLPLLHPQLCMDTLFWKKYLAGFFQ